MEISIVGGWTVNEGDTVPSLARSIMIRPLALEVEAVIVKIYLSRQ